MLETASTKQKILTAGTAGLVALLLSPVASADKPDPYRMADDSWITISGTVDLVDRDNFTLDYGDGAVTVRMDDGDRDADAYKLVAGDKVTVSGKIDDDFYEMTTINASSVYVENLATTFTPAHTTTMIGIPGLRPFRLTYRKRSSSGR